MDELRLGAARRVAMTAGEVARAVGGRLLNGGAERVIDGLSIDTRTLKPGELYVAIRGERLDGHAFVEAALRAGACGLLVSEPIAVPPAVLGDAVLIAVADTVSALQLVARWVRRQSGARVVGVTGSAGKTTTKDIAAAFLALRYRVMRSSGNLNNHIGLPLSLLGLREGPEIAVVELGMNHAGEIRRLVAIAEPETRVWTNVAEVHTAFFESIESIADAKAEILEGATGSTTLIANADDARVMTRAAVFPGRVVTFSARAETPATVAASQIEDLGLDGMRARVSTPGGSADWQLPLLGRGSLMNSLAGLAVGLEFDVPLADMAEHVARLHPAPHRGEVLRLAGGVRVVDDAYNSNPRALQAALAVVAADGRFGRRVAVLGEMLELGEQSLALHEECGRSAAAAGLSALITVGGEPAAALGRAATAAGLDAGAVRHCADSEEAAGVATATVHRGDVVLVKGSRGIRTELVVERLKAVFG